MIDTLIDFTEDHIFNVLLIVLVGILMKHFTSVLLKTMIRRSVRAEYLHSKAEMKRRERTLVGTLGAGLNLMILAVVILLLLAEFNVNIAPLIAGAGIAGIALGFGAQSLVKDFFAGIFIITENHYRVGDVVRLNNEVSGSVQSLSLRQTVLRDMDGMVHHIPNGNITLATNMTMEFANVNLNVGVGYETDIEKLESLVNALGEEMAQDEKWSKKIIEAPTFLRVDNFADSAIVVKIVGKTNPMEHWAVTGELRKRLKIMFDKNGIVIPYPQRVIHSATASKKS